MGGWAGGSEAFAPDPADLEEDTRASQSKEMTRTSEHSLTPDTCCTTRDRARGSWVGGGSKVYVSLAWTHPNNSM